MKLSDYVAYFLAQQGIKYVFAVTGGASAHLIDSIAKTPGIQYICPQHEQAGAMSADGYARTTGNLGAAIATSGPGGTNMITGICCSYYDSIPVIYITGQVSTFRRKRDSGVRQMGFQETDIVDICKPITKYSVSIDDPLKIRHELEKACYLTKSGRPGPVLIDIPDNIQREDINPDELEVFVSAVQAESLVRPYKKLEQCIKLIEKAKRPVVVLGWGVRLARAEKKVIEFINKTGFPVAPTWSVTDIFPSDFPALIGTFGTAGTRYGNFAVQNSDLILSVGARLDTRATGSPMDTFAREAVKIVVDIDPYELNKFDKFSMKTDLLINCDAGIFFDEVNKKNINVKKKAISDWIERIKAWKDKYPICPKQCYEQDSVNPYVFVKTLSKESMSGDRIFIDTGCALAWMMQAFEVKSGQRIFHDWNNTAMGWALPASIGGCLAMDRRPVICVTGDGSMQMNIQELATVIRHKLPIKIFLINNRGYGMIQQTQDQWLNSKYEASTVEGGLAFPDFPKVAQAYGYEVITVTKNKKLKEGIRKTLRFIGPVFCNIEIDAKERVYPQVKFGRPNEDAEPLLDREEFLKNMIVRPMVISRER